MESLYEQMDRAVEAVDEVGRELEQHDYEIETFLAGIYPGGVVSFTSKDSLEVPVDELREYLESEFTPEVVVRSEERDRRDDEVRVVYHPEGERFRVDGEPIQDVADVERILDEEGYKVD